MSEVTQADKDREKARIIVHHVAHMRIEAAVDTFTQAIADARKEERHRTLRALSAFNEEWRQELAEALETGEKEGERG
jgi:vacuolar-type H+-ATPase subunit H